MKRLISAILILLLTTQAFSKWMIVLEFEINKEYIAANLCQNRNKPVLKCAGKCQLAKQMAEEEENSSAPSKTQLKFQEVTFSQQAAIVSVDVATSEVLDHCSFYTLHTIPEPYFPIFHPPA